MGSGTTAYAAAINNRKYVGFEINPEYFEIIESRLNGNLNDVRRVKGKNYSETAEVLKAQTLFD